MTFNSKVIELVLQQHTYSLNNDIKNPPVNFTGHSSRIIHIALDSHCYYKFVVLQRTIMYFLDYCPFVTRTEDNLRFNDRALY